MSADLLAEFGFGAPANQSSGTEHQQAARPVGRSSSLIPDLEIFDNAPPTSIVTTHHSDVSTSHTSQPQTRPTHLRTSRKSDVSHSAGNINYSNVLFDATLEDPPDDDGEDWGEFESADPPSSQGMPTSFRQCHGNTLGWSEWEDPNDPKKLAVSPHRVGLWDSCPIEDKTPRSHPLASSALVDNILGHKNEIATSTTLDIAQEQDDFDEWGDFVDGPPQSVGCRIPAVGKVPTQNTKAVTKLEKNVSSTFNISNNPVSPDQIRPTNIPPPSVLLELFSLLFEQLRKEATEVRKNVQEKQNIDNVATLILCTLKTTARVVAGRTLRWKRDSILSQSMRIGPARSGKPGGMKLNTVNKNEDIKEQQEAVDVISMWRDRTALFNSVIQASGKRPIHVIAPNIRAINASTEQGALKASHACALCGLKREERLPKIDNHVEDSFGEWWTDHWGHTDCKQFWEKHVNLLSQR
ncbi:hypothetical protein BDV28DRAFT_140325 [Aspergillus coremiiformis]|uniref:Serine/threonine-protein kinase ppk6 n=1 Tax=Aspergillus coremiiformis TaxID=138285 RepID=A0A5N6YWN3_9EURO|nr:hypothetical protein BDV28DRAFT_140325 [Aspergillus coremiiformis]